MALDSWMLTEKSKIEGSSAALHIRHGRDSLALELGRNESEIRFNVERVRKALAEVIEANGGE